MSNVYFDCNATEAELRRGVHAGNIYVFGPRPSTQALVDLACERVTQAFAPLDPCEAQHQMNVEDFAALLSELKPGFMHDPQVKVILRQILADLGFDLEKMYFDVPRLRTMTHGDYLRTGIALAVPPHRDTWYAGTESQLNWWLPIRGVTSENTMIFHPEYFDRPVRNASNRYDHDAWQRHSRADAAKHIGSDTRAHPDVLEEIGDQSDLRILCPAGSLILFSASHLHSTAPNTSGVTRFSVDFRTVHIDDITSTTGAPNVDNQCHGSTLAEYMQACDLSPFPQEITEAYERPRPTAKSAPAV